MAMAATKPVSWLTRRPITDEALPMPVVVAVPMAGKIDWMTWAAQSSPGLSALQLMFMPELGAVCAMAGTARSVRERLRSRGQGRRIASSRDPGPCEDARTRCERGPLRAGRGTAARAKRGG